MMNEIITPKILRGTRDFLPKDMAKRNFVMDKIKSTFKTFGYDAIETPVIEYAETLMGKYGEEGNKLMYSFEDNGGRKIALRYDQTVPFARLVAGNIQNLPMPFKRYQISRVWRADRPAKGRYREFYQCDIDIIGTTNLMAEGEVARVIDQVFQSLGFKNYQIKFNSRRLINSILKSFDIPEKDFTNVIRSLDKLEKIGEEGVKKELMTTISSEVVDRLLKLMTEGGSNQEKVERLACYSTQEIAEFLKICQAYGVNESNLDFDVSLARGLDYYTGIIYEVFIPEVSIGAVCAGGRYDDLCSKFSKEKLSGVGVAFGFDRIIVAMEELGLLDDIQLNSKVLVTNFDIESINSSIQIVSELQQEGINAEIYLETEKLSKQFKYANKKEIPFVVICGPDEMRANELTVKSMQSGKQKTIPRSQLINYLKGYIQ